MTIDFASADASTESHAKGTAPRSVVRVGLFADRDLVRVGVSAVCDRHPDRLAWVERPGPGQQVDILLLDPWCGGPVTTKAAISAVRDSVEPRRLVCFTWRSDLQVQAQARLLGFDQVLSKGMREASFVAALTLPPVRRLTAPGRHRRLPQAG